MKIEIRNARVVDPANGVDKKQNLYIADGIITGLGKRPEGFKAERVIDAEGLIAIPGIVDLCARLCEPGFEHKATIASETAAAAASGITSLVCPPDTSPCVDTPAEARFIEARAERAGYCRVYPLGALSAGLQGNALSEMFALKEAGCLAVSNGLKPITDTQFLRRAMEYAASLDLPIFLYPLDAALANGGCAHEGAVASRLGLPGIPVAAETAALAQQLALVEHTGVRAHFCRLSCASSIPILRYARQTGLPVTADVAAHQLFLSEWDIGEYNALCHTLPPLRTIADRYALRAAVKEGIIDAICSDHQPHDLDAKQAPFPSTEPGISALETLLPLVLKLVADGVMSLSEAVARITQSPANILGIAAGTLAIGKPADICLIDPSHQWRVDPEALISRGKNTPFAGWEFTDSVAFTLLNGAVVFASAARIA